MKLNKSCATEHEQKHYIAYLADIIQQNPTSSIKQCESMAEEWFEEAYENTKLAENGYLDALQTLGTFIQVNRMSIAERKLDLHRIEVDTLLHDLNSFEASLEEIREILLRNLDYIEPKEQELF